MALGEREELYWKLVKIWQNVVKKGKLSPEKEKIYCLYRFQIPLKYVKIQSRYIEL